MIDPAIRIVGLDPREWRNLLRFLSTPAPLPGAGGSGRSGGLVLLHHDGRVLKAVHTERGRVDPPAWTGPEGLRSIAREVGARWVVALELSAPDELMHRVQERVRFDQDSVTQGLEIARVVRALLDDGRIAIHPRPLEGVPIPMSSTVARALDLALPDGRTAVAYLFDGPEIWTSVILRKTRGAFDLLAGHGALGLGPAEVRGVQDHPRVLEAVKRKFGDPYVGLFADKRTVERLLDDPRGGGWARAVALREVVVEPMSPWAGVVLGAGVVREAVDRSRKLLSKLDPLGLAQPLARAARERISATVDFKQILGFDPFEILARLVRLSDD